jgi:hypothetical protein
VKRTTPNDKINKLFDAESVEQRIKIIRLQQSRNPVSNNSSGVAFALPDAIESNTFSVFKELIIFQVKYFVIKLYFAVFYILRVGFDANK